MKKNQNELPVVPCGECYNIKNFSFKGCAKECEKILRYFKKIFSEKNSPCLKCGIPKLFKEGRIKCVGCRLPEIWEGNQRGSSGIKSPMGKPWAPSNIPNRWER